MIAVGFTMTAFSPFSMADLTSVSPAAFDLSYGGCFLELAAGLF
jgi:hypothetical protein